MRLTRKRTTTTTRPRNAAPRGTLPTRRPTTPSASPSKANSAASGKTSPTSSKQPSNLILPPFLTSRSAWKVPASISAVNRTYELSATLPVWTLRAAQLLAELAFQTARFACSGAVWTQTTDVEGEVNGMLTYDRRVNRMTAAGDAGAAWREGISAVYRAAEGRRGGGNGSVGVGVEGY